MNIKSTLKIEELSMFIAIFILFLHLGNGLVLFLVLLFLPDLGMLGYILNPKIGSITYNLTHNKTIGFMVIALGLFIFNNTFIILGLILLAHSSLDRALGYGLKFPDSFQNTHLGKIGKN